MRTSKNISHDIFAEIAKQSRDRRDSSLIEPQPEKLPQRFLPIKKGCSTKHLEKSPDIDTVVELEKELVRLRRKYTKYMNNKAPELISKRKRFYLKDFQWRKQTAADIRRFASHTQKGKGKWEKVKIPHYGPPLGKAVTYYRKEIIIRKMPRKNERIFLCFKGVDYKCRVFLNDYCLGEHEGFFAPFEFDITNIASSSKNTILIEVENDYICMGNPPISGSTLEGDKLYAATGCGWDDPEVGWHHCPPGMGIYQDVYYEIRPDVHVEDIFVRPLPDQSRVEAWLEVNSGLEQPQQYTFQFSIFGRNFKKTVFKDKEISASTLNIAGLGDLPKPDVNSVQNMFLARGPNYFKFSFNIPDFREWSPENPWLYELQVKILNDKHKIIDTDKQHFGMRSFQMEEEKNPRGAFYLNNDQIKLRGANTMGHLQQCVIKKDWDQLRDDILLAKICNLNFLRLTQRPVQPEIYDFCDMLGMMTQTDLPLFGCLRKNQFQEAVKQAQEMEKLVRCHPCNILNSYINEPFPNGQGKPHRNLDRKELEAFFQSADISVRQMNPDRVIKAVDGDYDPPGPGMPDMHCYPGWYTGHGIDLGKLHKGYWQPVKPGWNYGCGEFGSEGLDSVDTMRKCYPKAWLPSSKNEQTWDPDSIVCAQTGRFHYMWFDTQSSLKGWVKSSQDHQKWVIQVMTEAFRRDKRMHSFALHLLIDAFPGGWLKSVMDVKRKPKPAYFAYRKALSPLLVTPRSDKYAYFSNSPIEIEFWICNDTLKQFRNSRFKYQVIHDEKVLFSGQIKPQIPICSSKFQGFLKFNAPEVSNRDKILIRSVIEDNSGAQLTSYDLFVDVFPKRSLSSSKQIYIVGNKNCDSARLVNHLGFSKNVTKSVKNADIILISDIETYNKKKSIILEAVKNGATAIFMELPSGKWNIASQKIEVEACAMGQRHFISRKSGHPIVEDFLSNDFRFWYDQNYGYVTPILKTTFTASGFTPILLSGNPGKEGKWAPTLACGELKHGMGTIRINQLSLAERVIDNPAASIFARRLLNL